MAMYPGMFEQMCMGPGGLPMGRRANGFGASPLGPGGPTPAHQMNFFSGMGGMGGMGGHGMMGSPYGAGRYPYPMQPAAQLGMLGGGGITPIGFGGRMPRMNPMALAYMYGGMPSYMDMFGDPDDTGFWDGDDEEGELNPLAQLMRGQRGGGRAWRRGRSMTPRGCMPMGMM